MFTARLAVHHSDADLVAICGTEPMSECSRSDSQLPPLKLQHLLCLSSLLTLVPPTSGMGGVVLVCCLTNKILGSVGAVSGRRIKWERLYRDRKEVVRRGQQRPPRNDQKTAGKQVNDDVCSQHGWGSTTTNQLSTL